MHELVPLTFVNLPALTLLKMMLQTATDKCWRIAAAL